MAGEKYILVDFENIQPSNLHLLRDRGFTVRIFLGAVQERIPLKIVSSLQVFGTALEYVQTCGVGHNALDFYIAYFLGRQSFESPGSQFFVISRDTGFDPLLQNLRSHGVYCRRVTSAEEINQDHEFTESVHSLKSGELVHKVIESLTKRTTTRPRTIKTLRSAINALYKKKLLPQQIDEVVLELKTRGIISEGANRLLYHIESPEPSTTPPTPNSSSRGGSKESNAA